MKISIVTPSLNQARFLGRTLDSVAIQDGADLEHLVVDGVSTDDTIAILRSRPSVRWISERDNGQADAVNKGIRMTDGDIVGWLNSDDIYYPGAVARVVEFFQRNPGIDIVYGAADHIDVDDHPFEAYPTEPWDFERLKERCFICQPAVFFRRDVVQRHGTLDAALQYCMDYEYWLRLVKCGVRFAYLETKLAGSRMYPENKTLSGRTIMHREINDMVKRRLGRVPDRWLFSYGQVMLEARLGRRHDGSPRELLELSIRSVAAALRWNWFVSIEMLKTIVHLFPRVRQLLRRMLFKERRQPV